MDFLNQDIKFLPGVGPKKAEVLNKELCIFTVEDLLRHYPYRYVDRSRFYKLSEISEEMPFIQVKGEISITPSAPLRWYQTVRAVLITISPWAPSRGR